jgi:cytoskeletal protein RodZ
MVSFIPKKISEQDSLGEELRRARNEKKLNIDEVSKIIQIRRDYLLALEAEDFDLLPSGLYGKNFLKKYADFLKIEPKKIADFLQQLESTGQKDDPFSQKVLNKKKFLIFPKIVRNILVSLAVLACFLYLVFYFKNTFIPPKLEITQPQQNLMISETTILISGETEPGAEVTINDELILADNNGNFSQLINLKKGMNTLKISAKKKYSRENIIIRQILVE